MNMFYILNVTYNYIAFINIIFNSWFDPLNYKSLDLIGLMFCWTVLKIVQNTSIGFGSVTVGANKTAIMLIFYPSCFICSMVRPTQTNGPANLPDLG